MDVNLILDNMEKAARTTCQEFETFSSRIYNLPGWCVSFRHLKRVIASSILQETLKEKANFVIYMTYLVAKDSLFKFYLTKDIPEPLDSVNIGKYAGAVYFVMPNGLVIDDEEISVISFCSIPDTTSVIITGTSIKGMRIIHSLVSLTDSVITAPVKSYKLVGTALALISKLLTGQFTEQSFVKTARSGKEIWDPGVLTNDNGCDKLEAC
jgi:hypothetical protein